MVMAVYEHTYRQYAGPLTPEWSRFLIIPRHAYRDVFKSKLFTAFFVVCFVPLLVEAILIYLHHNFSAIATMNLKALIPIDASFFLWFVSIQAGFAFLLAILVGPPLVARDLTNNALPLYLCRPFSRSEYVLGKMCVLLILLSAITWAPQLLLFALQAYLEGFSWFVENLWLASAIFLSGVMWILVLTLLSQTVSAWVKWRLASSAALLGFYLIPWVFAEFVFHELHLSFGHLLSIEALRRNVTAGLFGTFGPLVRQVTEFDGNLTREIVVNEPPLWLSWFVLFLLCAICLALLSRKVKAYEVIS